MDSGHRVVGVDKLAANYDPRVKLANLAGLLRKDNFEFVCADLGELDIASLLLRERVELIFHEAALAGVRDSWGSGFTRYVSDNIVATQKLLEACLAVPVRRLVFASSSSVYGAGENQSRDEPGARACDIANGSATVAPTTEIHPTSPHSPYGVTKLAAESLCLAYYRNFDVPTVALRYFTVYGPRQRPDMAIHKLLDALCHDLPFSVYGDGGQRRDFTYVDDVIRANLLAAEATVETVAGKAFNIGCGRTWALLDVVREAEEVTGRKAVLRQDTSKSGDVPNTWADISRANAILGWRPEIQLREGLERQFRWQSAE